MKDKLPPLPDEAFDGEHEKTEIKFIKCPHKDVSIVNRNELRCKCGSGWSGPNIAQLYKLFKAQTSS